MKTFTPQEVNDLERSAYMAGMSVERQRYEKLLENKIMMTQLDFAGYMENSKQDERERIKQEIMSRVTDLKSCGSNDNCEEIAELLLDWMPEWLGEDK